MSEALIVDDLRFELRRSTRRKTIGITVERDGSLFITAPVDCPREEIEETARQKQFWVYSKLARKYLLMPSGPAKEYVSGEGFPYLGRSYRLLLVAPTLDGAVPALRLHQGRFLLRRDERERGAQHFTAWYKQHGQPWLHRKVALLAGRIGVEPWCRRGARVGLSLGLVRPGWHAQLPLAHGAPAAAYRRIHRRA